MCWASLYSTIPQTSIAILLYVNGSFLQVLERQAESIARLLIKISRDPRHNSVKKIIQRQVTARKFVNWSMG